MTSQTGQIDDSDKITPALLKIAGVVVLGAIMSILDVTVVNVALPTFQTELSGATSPWPTRRSPGPPRPTCSRSRRSSR